MEQKQIHQNIFKYLWLFFLRNLYTVITIDTIIINDLIYNTKCSFGIPLKAKFILEKNYFISYEDVC